MENKTKSMFGEGIPWSILLPIAFMAFLTGINAGKRSKDNFKNHIQSPEDESSND